MSTVVDRTYFLAGWILGVLTYVWLDGRRG